MNAAEDIANREAPIIALPEYLSLWTFATKMLAILRKARLKDKEMRILMLYVYSAIHRLCFYLMLLFTDFLRFYLNIMLNLCQMRADTLSFLK